VLKCKFSYSKKDGTLFLGHSSQSVFGKDSFNLGISELFVDVEATKKSSIFGLDIVGEDFDGEISHSHLSIEVFELAFDHNIESLEQQRVKVGLNFLLTLILFKFFKLLSFHTHERSSVLPCKININGLCKVRDLGRDHIGRQIGQELLVTVLTLESCCLLYHLSPTVLRHASRIEDSVVILDARNVAIQEKEVVVVRVILVAQTLIDLANQVQVAVPLRSLAIAVASILVVAAPIHLIPAVIVRWTPRLPMLLLG
jgi:hypothetical protein